MKLKFTLRRHNGAPPVDLMATVDTGATVGDLAERLWRADPLQGGSPVASHGPGAGRATLVVDKGTGVALDPSVRVADSGLRSGMTVALTWAPEAYAAQLQDTVAVVTVLGPGGQELPVRSLSAVIGRDPECAVVLSDPLVSRRHARLTIGVLPEIVDLGSANGIEVNGARVTRAVLRPDDVVQLGDTRFTVRVLSSAAATLSADGAADGHIRSPRLDPRYPGETFEAPEPPKPADPPRFPVIAAVTPLIMGGILYLVTRSAFSLVFVLFSPLMVIGYAIEGRLAGKAAFKKAVKHFRAELAELTAQAERAAAEEVAARGREHPTLSECIDAVQRRTPLLWTRRPDDPGFCEFRLGLGRQPSRSEITVSSRRDVPRDLAAEVMAVRDRFRYVDNVPVLAQPLEHGAIGVAGPRELVLGAARSFVAQAVALHSPAELVLVAVAADQRARDWQWLAWLPHTTSPHSPLKAPVGRAPVWPLAATHEEANALVSAVEDLIATREGERRSAGGGSARPAGPVVLVLVEDAVPVERSRLVEIAERGWRQGVVVLWLAEDVTQLPAACRHFVTVQPGSPQAAAGFVHTGELVQPLQVDLLDAATADALGRRLAPVVDVGARVEDASDLPRTVSLLSIGDRPVSPSAEYILERWRENRSILTGPYATTGGERKAGTLRAVIGRSAAGPHALDLREDGPHALVGGTTGSGKSELLQAWILAMAAAHSPQRLTFMLIDYKGGSAFKDLVYLPHTVGLFTDLDPHLVRRALTSLRAEFKAREELFAKYRVKDLLELEREGVAEAPPSLVIVVDEFAALVKELPEFIDGVVDVAQRGRSLGVHLILATQRPAGVIRENLRANTNLRLALRTADENDSVDVLGTPQAAHFDPSIPGRAVSKTGPGRLVVFQAGYGGGWTSDAPPPPEILIEELRFGRDRAVWRVPEVERAPIDLGPTDIQRMIGAIVEATKVAGLRRPRQPWLPELQRVYDLEKVPRRRVDHELVFGVQDLPEQQAQPPVAFYPDKQGNLAVYGTGGSGKSTLLRTIAIAAAATASGGPCHVYGLDFGNRSLAMLEELPHVGSIVVGTDHDRIARLIRWLAALVAERGERYSRVGAGTITAYRTIANAPQEPRILLLVDGIAAFRQAYEVGDRARIFDALTQIATDGRAVGVHVLITADRPASVPSALAAQIQTRIVLRMADPNDYQSLGVPLDVLKPASPPGRGLLGDVEIQVAVLGGATDNYSQASMVTQLAESMRRAGVTPAPAVRAMPERVVLAELPATVNGLPVLGLAAETLEPMPFTPVGGFLIAGPPQSGRTAAMRALATALRRFDPTMRLYLFVPGRRSELAGLSLWAGCYLGAEQARDGAEQLTAVVKAAQRPPMAVFVENPMEFAAGAADIPMQELVRTCLAEDVFVVAEGEASTLGSTMGVPGLVKQKRYGLALCPDPTDGDRLFRTPF
ncbi:MAG: FHA domain-containing protein, partial [Micromonosporaceae bacterium]|nr:FHA domain-containing protein [Micromonosporaceae bacterium]